MDHQIIEEISKQLRSLLVEDIANQVLAYARLYPGDNFPSTKKFQFPAGDFSKSRSGGPWVSKVQKKMGDEGQVVGPPTARGGFKVPTGVPAHAGAIEDLRGVSGAGYQYDLNTLSKENLPKPSSITWLSIQGDKIAVKTNRSASSTTDASKSRNGVQIRVPMAVVDQHPDAAQAWAAANKHGRANMVQQKTSLGTTMHKAKPEYILMWIFGDSFLPGYDDPNEEIRLVGPLWTPSTSITNKLADIEAAKPVQPGAGIKLQPISKGLDSKGRRTTRKGRPNLPQFLIDWLGPQLRKSSIGIPVLVIKKGERNPPYSDRANDDAPPQLSQLMPQFAALMPQAKPAPQPQIKQQEQDVEQEQPEEQEFVETPEIEDDNIQTESIESGSMRLQGPVTSDVEDLVSKGDELITYADMPEYYGPNSAKLAPPWHFIVDWTKKILETELPKLFKGTRFTITPAAGFGWKVPPSNAGPGVPHNQYGDPPPGAKPTASESEIDLARDLVFAIQPGISKPQTPKYAKMTEQQFLDKVMNIVLDSAKNVPVLPKGFSNQAAIKPVGSTTKKYRTGIKGDTIQPAGLDQIQFGDENVEATETHKRGVGIYFETNCDQPGILKPGSVDPKRSVPSPGVMGTKFARGRWPQDPSKPDTKQQAAVIGAYKKAKEEFERSRGGTHELRSTNAKAQADRRRVNKTLETTSFDPHATEREEIPAARHELNQQIYRLASEAETLSPDQLDPLLKQGSMKIIYIVMQQFILTRYVNPELSTGFDELNLQQLKEHIDTIESLSYTDIQDEFEQYAAKYANNIRRVKANAGTSDEVTTERDAIQAHLDQSQNDAQEALDVKTRNEGPEEIDVNEPDFFDQILQQADDDEEEPNKDNTPEVSLDSLDAIQNWLEKTTSGDKPSLRSLQSEVDIPADELELDPRIEDDLPTEEDDIEDEDDFNTDEDVEKAVEDKPKKSNNVLDDEDEEDHKPKPKKSKKDTFGDEDDEAARWLAGAEDNGPSEIDIDNLDLGPESEDEKPKNRKKKKRTKGDDEDEDMSED